MKNTSTNTPQPITMVRETNRKILQNCHEDLAIIEKSIHQHVESVAPLRYLDAIKDALHTQGMLERRLHALRQQSNEKNRADIQSEIDAITYEIRLLKSTIKSIIQIDG